jgi:rRNA maturation endonuclease Nob1
MSHILCINCKEVLPYTKKDFVICSDCGELNYVWIFEDDEKNEENECNHIGTY